MKIHNTTKKLSSARLYERELRSDPRILEVFSDKEINQSANGLAWFSNCLPHNKNPYKLFLYHITRDQVFGNTFSTLLELGYVDMGDSYVIGESTKQYSLGATFARSISTNQKAQLATFEIKDSVKPFQVDQPIRSRRAGNTSHRTFQAEVKRWLSIDMDSVKDLALTSDNPHLITRAFGLLEKAATSKHYGCVYANYEQKNCGRVYSGIQTWSKELRKAALNGFWGYDIAAAHPCFLARNTKTKTPALDKYISDPARYRNLIATQTGVNLNTVKRSIIALIFAASTHDNRSIHDLCGNDEAFNQLRSNGMFKDIESEVKTAGVELINKHMKLGHLVNPVGQRFKGENKFSSKLAHILQGYESLALEAMVNASNGQMLMLHDGIYCKERQSIECLEKSVYEALGFHISIVEERLEYKTGKAINTPEAPINKGVSDDSSIRLKELYGRFSSSPLSLSPFPCVLPYCSPLIKLLLFDVGWSYPYSISKKIT